VQSTLLHRARGERAKLLYAQANFALVFETSAQEQFTYATERGLQPLHNRKPFVVLGPPHYLALLRAAGFETFAPVINETYDTIVDYPDRLAAVVAEVRRLVSLDGAVWKSAGLQHSLDHNYYRLACGGLTKSLSNEVSVLLELASQAA